MRPEHLPDKDYFDGFEISSNSPFHVMVSGCLAGAMCGYHGDNYGEFKHVLDIINHPNVRATSFCPEEFSFGTPREICDIHGGDGMDVLAGRARVISESGEDWTQKMIIAANWMAGLAKENQVQLAILMDTSAACGSQVIYDGARKGKNYQIGLGVCAAKLYKEGIPIVSQRDLSTLTPLLDKLGLDRAGDGLDHHERDWYKKHFGTPAE